MNPTILGIDFTSAPNRRKPITCARAHFDGDTLRLDQLSRWTGFDGFEEALVSPGPWVAGLDFPFGQARTLVENIGWPEPWHAYVEVVAGFDRRRFRSVLEDYKKDRAAGDKHHKRVCDVLSRSQSPQTLFGTPVGLMFFEGAQRLLRADVHLPWHRDGDPSRIALEAYPGIAVRHLVGNVAYKSDDRRRQSDAQKQARGQILGALRDEAARSIYGFVVDAPDDVVLDPGADDLDALLCAVQAAWGWSNRDRNFGAPENIDRLEGWIADPALLDADACV